MKYGILSLKLPEVGCKMAALEPLISEALIHATEMEMYLVCKNESFKVTR